jgi:hypothetical protein
MHLPNYTSGERKSLCEFRLVNFKFSRHIRLSYPQLDKLWFSNLDEFPFDKLHPRLTMQGNYVIELHLCYQLKIYWRRRPKMKLLPKFHFH